ncbi:NADP-dependent phosphogluconate dehydrogenase [archaeon]|jgi:6-phosphogluconate dehydrogenase|nr:NADP-dependent phosphogluconate dehydrogenase [archaeon]MBT4648289.1 NADP-dependent phosphogluconate dehydrogenase [archaeon]MBT6821541.1 NADP-dependent phosphogluconate dehydrogenase [archaeon]MBT7391940.1 NADP-dependent phosphogluconate dehydrogenase [archaeon]
MGKPKLAMIGMGVMGSMFAQNFAEKGYDIALYNRTESKTKDVYISTKDKPYHNKLHPVTGPIKNLVDVVGNKGTYFIMVKAGFPTISVAQSLLPLLKKGAVIIDLANSNYHETIKLEKEVSDAGIHFFGVGVSGGEEGARYGPSIMPGGGNRKVYNNILKKPLEDVSAKAPQDGLPCVTYCGLHGAGHFVKMVHNGIEYADMELIAESYDLMSRALDMSADEISDVFKNWNKGKLKSYLIEIAAEVLSQKEPNGKDSLIDFILDKAKMKGTGTWTIMSSLEMESGVVSIPTIYAAVESRAISFRKEQRVEMNKKLSFPIKKYKGNKKKLIDDLETAMYVAKIACYNQGIDLIQTGDKDYSFGGIDIAKIAEIWRDGCIIRAEFLGDITNAYRKNPKLINLIAAPKFKKAILDGMDSLNNVCSLAIQSNLPFMAYDTSRSYIIQSTSSRLPANMIQGLRDFFGAHTYERCDKKGNYHTLWADDERKEVKK